MSRPLSLPAGSVRALLLLALCARAIVDLRYGRDLAPWLGAAIVVSAAAYFGHRAAVARRPAVPAPAPAIDAPPPPRPPLGLPAGTVRTLFLGGVAYATWLWSRSHHGLESHDVPVATVLCAFLFGVATRWLLTRMRGGDDEGTLAFEHGQALVALLAAGGLVALSATGRPLDVPPWVEPALAAVCTYYAGAR